MASSSACGRKTSRGYQWEAEIAGSIADALRGDLLTEFDREVEMAARRPELSPEKG